MKLKCCVCSKKFKSISKDKKLKKNRAFCSEAYWFNNTLSHE